MNIKYLFLIFIYFSNIICFDIKIDVIKDFSKFNYVSDVNLLVCWQRPKLVRVIRSLNDYGIKVALCKDWEMEKCLRADYNVGFIVDENCLEFQDYITKASKNRKFRANQFWLILSSKSVNTTFWQTINLGADSDVTLINDGDLKANTLMLNDIYNTGYENEGTLVSKEVGTWSKDKGIDKYSKESKVTLRSDLKGILIKSSAIIVYRFKKQTLSHYLKTHGDTDIITKSHIFVTKLISEMFKMRVTYRRIYRWGELNKKTDTYDGQIGLMQRGIIDVGGSNHYLRPYRMYYINYIGQSSYQSSIILFKQPGTLSDSTSGFLKPLHYYVWYSSAVMAVLTILSFLLSTIVEHFVIIKKKLEGNEVSSSLLVVVAMFCQQSSETKSSIHSMRLIVITCSVFSFLLMQFYSASIVSSLLSEPPRLIKTTQDLLHSDFQMRIHNVIYHKTLFEMARQWKGDFTFQQITTLFQNTQIKIAKQLYEKKCANGTNKDIFVTMQEGIKLVLQGGFALYGDTNDIYSYLRHSGRSCELDQLYIVPKDYLYLCSKKTLPVNNMIAVGLRRLHERGLLLKEESLWRLHKPKCSKQGARTEPVGLPETRAAFLLLLWGHLMAAMFLVTETLFWRRQIELLPFIL